jgi:integrase
MPKKTTRIKNNIQNNENISQNDKNFLVNRFLKNLQRIAGIESDSTLYSYLRYAELICEKEDFEVTELTQTEIKARSEQIADGIQDSKYKRNDGDLVERNKNKAWTTWKRLLDYQDLPTEQVPDVSFSTDKAEADIQAGTTPQDLPTPKEVRRFLKTMEQISEPQTSDRNLSLILLLWSEGPRIGEALDIQMDQVSTSGKVPRIRIEGNKGSEDRSIKIGQGYKTLNEYISSHPAPKDPDAYLFHRKKNGSVYDKLATPGLRRKVSMAHQKSSVSFKIYGEPFHIFRKGMTTFHIVNELATWEEVAKKQGKKVDGTKPTYLKMSIDDVNASVLDSLGVEEDGQQDGSGHRMKGKPLTPMQCPSCQHLNRCYRNICSKCNASLNPEELPDNLQTDEPSKAEAMQKVQEFGKEIEQLKKDISDK